MANRQTQQIQKLKEELQSRFGLPQKLSGVNTQMKNAADKNGTEVAEPLASFIDHTLLKPDATNDEIKHLCEEAVHYCFKSVCVNPGFVSYAYTLLQGKQPLVCTVVGFPLGATTTETKVFEARQAVANGAAEVDMVLAIGYLKSQDFQSVYDDIRAVVDAVSGKALVKVILETAFLTDEEKISACILAQLAGADYVKTSTGFSKGGATVEDIQLMRKTVGPHMGVKASGGVRTREQALAMIAAGATRIGASASVTIVSANKNHAEEIEGQY